MCKEICSTHDGATKAHLWFHESPWILKTWVKKKNHSLYLLENSERTQVYIAKSLPFTLFPASQVPFLQTVAWQGLMYITAGTAFLLGRALLWWMKGPLCSSPTPEEKAHTELPCQVEETLAWLVSYSHPVGTLRVPVHMAWTENSQSPGNWAAQR